MSNAARMHYEKAQNLLRSVQGKRLTASARAELACELGSHILEAKKLYENRKNKRQMHYVASMIQDKKAKAFTIAVTDTCFRTKNAKRAIDQIIFLLKTYGYPSFLTFWEKIGFILLKHLGRFFPKIAYWRIKREISKKTKDYILPGEEYKLNQHLLRRAHDGIKVNLNRLGEAILGEYEAEARFQKNLSDLTNPLVSVISVKVSSIFSQIHPIAWDATIESIKSRLRTLYRTCKEHSYKTNDGSYLPKFVNLDMEEYKDLHLTVQVFCEVLSEEEFLTTSAGIALQSYLPDSFLLLQKICTWAQERREKGGAPVKVRIVKGANLAMEKVEASLKGWPQAPYTKKCDVDANFKRMLHYAVLPQNIDAVHIGIGSHNLFDIAYVLILREELTLQGKIEFEMLEGMAEPLMNVIKNLAKDILLYCPVAEKKEFHTAIAYLVRRLDENTSKENFLSHIFDITPGSDVWTREKEKFVYSCELQPFVSTQPRRTQSRSLEITYSQASDHFQNDQDTDFTLSDNRLWAQEILHTAKSQHYNIPLVIAGIEIKTNSTRKGYDPSLPTHEIYEACLAEKDEIEKAIICASSSCKSWSKTTIEERVYILKKVKQNLQKSRNLLLGAMLQECAKPLLESDPEISEAIDFVEYYANQLFEYSQGLLITFSEETTCLVASPWNFPCSIPVGGIISALASGMSVIFKPAPEALLVGWHIANALWTAGIPKDVLQFISCADDPYGTMLINDPRIHNIILTGSTVTARTFLEKRPTLRLFAETGGKNSIIVSNLADRDLAVKDIIQSAFSYSGQKCSACSVAILHKEVYNDPQFKKQLIDATQSLTCSSAWNPQAKVVPLIREASPLLFKALTTLEEKETWLVKPEQDRENHNLWSPGIKWDVTPGSTSHVTEFFGPLLSVICAEDLEDAIEIANQTPYGLTAGIHSLDTREHTLWLSKIQAGNCYINRSITGAIVGRQPFGGCKASSFGIGMKAGGPNYLLQLLSSRTIDETLQEDIENDLTWIDLVARDVLSLSEYMDWAIGSRSYAFWWNHHFSKKHILGTYMGQENTFYYVPREMIHFIINDNDSLLDILLVLFAAQLSRTKITFIHNNPADKASFLKSLKDTLENEQWDTISLSDFIENLHEQTHIRVRMLTPPDTELAQNLKKSILSLDISRPHLHGRIELIHFLREVSVSYDYHRYGNLEEKEVMNFSIQ